MTRRSKARFVLPFALGTVLGALGGVTLGTVAGQRLRAALGHVWSVLLRNQSDNPPFDLLLQ